MLRTALIRVAPVLVLLIGCNTQSLPTGEPLVYGVKPLSGEIVDRDISIKSANSSVGIVPHKGEMISIVVNNVFIRYLKEIGNPHVLIYSIVHDDGTDDPGTPKDMAWLHGLDKAAFKTEGVVAGYFELTPAALNQRRAP